MMNDNAQELNVLINEWREVDRKLCEFDTTKQDIDESEVGLSLLKRSVEIEKMIYKSEIGSVEALKLKFDCIYEINTERGLLFPEEAERALKRDFSNLSPDCGLGPLKAA